MQRRVLFLDGTWNDDREDDDITNVVRLRDHVKKAWPDITDRHRYYDKGVGTGGPVDRVLGGTLGYGLSENVRQAYTFLARNFQPGDEIYIFGFSRGAFTARSLAGFVGASGLLRAEMLDENLIKAWAHYRIPPAMRPSREAAGLTALCHDNVRIKFLGVFDTVGWLGVPLWSAGNWIGSLDRFHDTQLGASVDYAFHAVSIDEHRRPYVPTLWAKPAKEGNLATQQVWFPGVHSDVGGGRDRKHDLGRGRTPFSDISLAWMISRIKAHTGLPVDPFALPAAPKPGEPREHFGWFLYSRAAPMIRLISQTPLDPPFTRPHEEFKSPEPPFREFLHVSALDLMADASLEHPYRPPNLVSVVPLVRSGALKMVGYDGNELNAAETSALLARLL